MTFKLRTMPPTAIARLLALGGELLPGTPRRKYELAHMHALLAALGSPEQRFRSVLIAGTNGKGSTAATLASILQAAGHRVGLYTSPHLEQPNERIRVNGVAISNDSLSSLFAEVERASATLVEHAQLPAAPSFFETMTAIAFLYFAGAAESATAAGASSEMPRQIHTPAVDIAILEVGLGGRLDATNVVDPLLSVLTDISLDHEEWLGATIAAITREKAGILREGGTLITLPQHPEANQVIGEVAVPLGVHAVNAADYLPLRTASPGHSALPSAGLENSYSVYLPPAAFGGATLQVNSPLAGAHQQRNIALALAAAVTLQQFGLPVTVDALEQGIRQTSWPGRLQLLHPPAGSLHAAPVLLDAAHNPAGAWALRSALSALEAEGSKTLVFGCMADKAIEELAQILFPVFDDVFLTRAASGRSAPIALLSAAAEKTGASYQTFSTAHSALAAAQAGTPANGLVVVAGSISLLGECFHSLDGWK